MTIPMTKILRRSKRYDRFLPISVVVVDGEEKTTKAGPFPGRIINISRHGACLLMSQVMINSYHLFHSTKEDDMSFLQLTVNVQPEIKDCKIPSRPVWMDIFEEGDIRAFRIGVEFMVNPDGEQMKSLEQVISKK